MRKTVKTGRGTGKTYETIEMMLRDKDLYTIVPNKRIYKSILNMFVEVYPKSKVSTEDMNDILNRIITPNDLKDGKIDKGNKFHIEEADRLLADLLGIEFGTMTTSHWYVETFRRNKYEKEGL